MRRSQVSDGCQQLMLKTLESQNLSFDQSLESNPLHGLLESSTLSRTGQRDLQDLTSIAVGHGMSVCEDLEF